MKRIDWLTNKEQEEVVVPNPEIKPGQLWKKYTDTNARMSVYLVKSVNDDSITIKSVLNNYGRGTVVTKEFLESNYILTTLEEVQKIPQYSWLDSSYLPQ